MNSTIMMRRDLLQGLGFYRYEAQYSEDYDLWTRANFATTIANLPEFLVNWRSSGQGVSRIRRTEMYQKAFRVMHAAIQQLIPDHSSIEKSKTLFEVLMASSDAPVPFVGRDARWQLLRYVRLVQEAFLRRFETTAEDRDLIMRDIELKVAILAVITGRHSVGQGMETFAFAKRIFPGIFDWHIPLLSRDFAYSLLSPGTQAWLKRVVFGTRPTAF